MGETAAHCRQLRAHSVLTCPRLTMQQCKKTLPKTLQNWRTGYNNTIPFLQVWFSSMLSSLVTMEFYLELERIQVFPRVPSLILLYSQHLPCSLLLSSTPLLLFPFLLFMSNPFLSAQAKQGLLLCSHSLH